MKLYGPIRSINVRKVIWACAELGLELDYELIENILDWDQLIKLNPNAMFPILEDGDMILWESNAICRYLAGKLDAQTLLPLNVKDRAHVEKWMDWQATDFNTAWRYAFMGLVREHPKYQDKPKQAEGVESWNAAVKIVSDQIGETGLYMTGSEFTLADIVIGLSLNRWLRSPIERANYPIIDDYMARLLERPAFQIVSTFI